MKKNHVPKMAPSSTLFTKPEILKISSERQKIAQIGNQMGMPMHAEACIGYQGKILDVLPPQKFVIFELGT